MNSKSHSHEPQFLNRIWLSRVFSYWTLLAHDREKWSHFMPSLRKSVDGQLNKAPLEAVAYSLIFLPASLVSSQSYLRKKEWRKKKKATPPSCYLDQQKAFVCNLVGTLKNVSSSLRTHSVPLPIFQNPKQFNNSKTLQSLSSPSGYHPKSDNGCSLSNAALYFLIDLKNLVLFFSLLFQVNDAVWGPIWKPPRYCNSVKDLEVSCSVSTH